ncbi:MAG: aldose epimerase family protein [Breznakibacter sp.]
MPQITFKKVATLQGKDILLFRLGNPGGAYVEVTNYGATLVSFAVAGARGEPENIILGYDHIEDYFADAAYIGSTVGRFANRIAGARFSLGGKTYHLDKNDGDHSNHGGFAGFNSRVFDYRIEEDRLVLTYESPDGESGFPGNMIFSVTYSFLPDNRLHIGYRAVSGSETIFNPTNHAYFNLTGGKGNVLDHELRIWADSYLETDSEFIPTGKVLPVSGSAFDFREYTAISRLMPLKKEILQGYNTYFIGNPTGELQCLASLRERSSGKSVDVYSTMPGVQVYTGDYLSGKHRPFAGICLEAQFYPDGPNHPHFGTCILKPEEEVRHTIIFALGNETSMSAVGSTQSV